ncbi:N-acetylmuramoyl-L-alanine amidase [Candidatus Sumerlaeota bacterium]|nr:N-acetylmuramoyl-L-alanine amidase [Candidatus Sumerlaeota bacterium]
MKDICLSHGMVDLGISLKMACIGMAFLLCFSNSAKCEEQSPGQSTQDFSSSLKGKKICLDPGHGGMESGAVGVKGLKEKDVNLREAFILKEMLEKAGATVILTRSEDKSVSLTDRCKLNKQHNTDLFLSLHHNANAQGDSSMNRIESFYHFKDDGGPSEDAARRIHREMQATLKLPGKPYMCWAYGVLRENAYPAVLIEPSYLANPEEEQRLDSEEYLRAIAAAYFRGIEKFFEGGRPLIKMDGKITPHPDGSVTGEIVSKPGDALVDPQRIRIELDGKQMYDYFFNPDTGKLIIRISSDRGKLPRALAISARNLSGNASFVEKRELPIMSLKDSVQFETKSALFGGILNAKKIIVDPEGGGDDAGAIGEHGLRAADVNLNTALYLYDYLRRAGADVSITRSKDQSMDNVARARFGLERNPDVFLTIGHRLPEPGMNEKPGMNVSRSGARWDGGREISGKMAFHLRQLLGTGKELGDINSRAPLPTEDHNWSSWEVMHAAQEYTAVYVCPLMFDAPGAEERLSSSAACRKEALAILYGLADYFGLNDAQMASIGGTVVDRSSGKPLANALVWLNSDLVFQTESDGAFLFKYLTPGKHEIKAMHGDYHKSSQTLDVGEKKQIQLKIEMLP